MNVLLDTNVILDTVLQRAPWHKEADAIVQAAALGQVSAAATTLSLATVLPCGDLPMRLREYPLKKPHAFSPGLAVLLALLSASTTWSGSPHSRRSLPIVGGDARSLKATITGPEFHASRLFVGVEDLASPLVKRLREEYRLDDVVKGESDEFRKLLKLRHWVHSRWHIDNDQTFNGDVFAILEKARAGAGFNCSHAMKVQHAVLTAMGFVVRDLGVQCNTEEYPHGFHHGVNEVWSNDLARWVLMDGEYDLHFERDGQVLSALEAHEAARRDGGHGVNKVQGPLRTVVPMKGQGFPFTSVVGYWWTSYHVRQNVFTQPKGNESRLVVLDSDAFRSSTWLRKRGDNALRRHWAYDAKAFVPTRSRHDIEWTPGVPALEVRCLSADELKVEIRSSTPNFAAYQVRLNGGPGRDVTDGEVVWKLTRGDNTLAVRTRNAAGVLGPEVTATVSFSPPAEAQVRTGRYRGDLIDPATGSVMMKAATQVPDKLPAENHLGLIFLFHGFKGQENNYIGLTVEALKRLQLDDQYVVISGKSKGPGWTTEDDARVLHVLQWARQTYPIDPRRVFIFGSSNGAAYVGRFGSAHQDLIAGVVGYCGNYKFDPALKVRPAALRNEWYFVHGGKDRPQNSRRACDTLKEHGYRYVFRQMDGYGHTDIWDSISHPDKTKANAVRDDWLQWLHALRHKEIAPTSAELRKLASLEKGKDVQALLAEAARIGGEPGSRVIARALSSTDPVLRAAAAKTAQRTLFDDEVIATLVHLLDDESADVRESAADGLAAAANWRHADAQKALTRKALAASAPVADRVKAIAALLRASRLALLGNCEDGLPIWSLVLLLDDERRPVREAAFAALEEHVPDTFGYQPYLPDQRRAAVMELWKHWCRQQCGPAPKFIERMKKADAR
jgi:predicted esterase